MCHASSGRETRALVMKVQGNKLYMETLLWMRNSVAHLKKKSSCGQVDLRHGMVFTTSPAAVQ